MAHSELMVGITSTENKKDRQFDNFVVTCGTVSSSIVVIYSCVMATAWLPQWPLLLTWTILNLSMDK